MKTKYIVPSFAFYDRTGIRNYLEKQAAKGWLLDKTGNYCWQFRRMEPKKLRFCVTYFPQADLYDPAPSEAEKTFQEFCAHGGWTLAGSNAQLQIFYSESENPLPIETDPVMEVDNIHKSMKKGMLTAYWLLLVNCLIQFVNQGIGISTGLVNYLSNGMNLFLALLWIVMFVLSVARLVCYYGWHRKARRAAEADGVFVETRSLMWAEHLVAALVFGGMTGMILTLEDRRMALVLSICLALALLVVVLVELFRRLMKYMGYDARESRKATLIATLILALLLCLVGIPAMTTYVMNNVEDDRVEDLRLSIQDLLGEEAAGHQTMVLTDNDSLFLGYQRIYQHPEGPEMIPTLDYDLVEVKASFLYERCLAEMMTVPAYLTEGAFQCVDPVPWGAAEAWQMYDGEEMRNWYVLCYEDVILEIIPSWEITEDQMGAVGKIFG